MVKGVAQVNIFGAQKFAVQIDVDPRQLAARNLDIDEVATRDRARQRQPADRHALRPGPHVCRQDRRPADERRGVPAARSCATATAGRSGSTKSRNVYDGVENDKQASWFNDARTIYLAVNRQPGTNTVEIVDSIRALLPQIQAQLPAALDAAASAATGRSRFASRSTTSSSRCS